jgi:hypothetical protein
MLTDTAARGAKPRAKPYKLADGQNMYLLVRPDGARSLISGERLRLASILRLPSPRLGRSGPKSRSFWRKVSTHPPGGKSKRSWARCRLTTALSL